MKPADSPLFVILSVVFLVVANLVPLGGVLFLGWDGFTVILLYWAENVVVGIFTLARIFVAEGQASSAPALLMRGRIGCALFFSLHFGLFTFGHGAFVIGIFGGGDGNPFDIGIWSTGLSAITLGWIGLLLSHGFTFVLHDLIRGERKAYCPEGVLFRPYARIVPMHLGILAALFLIRFFNEPIVLLVFLVLGKLIIDVLAHLFAHSGMVKVTIRTTT